MSDHQTNITSHAPAAWQPGMLLCCLGFLLVLAGAAMAAEEGRFAIRTVYTELRDGVIFLNADIDYELSEVARDALANGVDLTVELQIEVVRNRRYWVDRDVASLLQRYQLSYQPLSERYITRNLNSGDQESFAELAMALESLGKVRNLPLLDDTFLNPGKRYEIRVRAVLDTRELAGPLRLLTVFWRDWRLASEWYEWPLRI